MMRVILCLVAALTACVASAQMPPPSPPILRDPSPGPIATIQQFSIRSIQSDFLKYDWSPQFGFAEKWLVTGEVVPSSVPGGGCKVCIILDGNLTGFVQYDAITFFDLKKLDHFDFVCEVYVPSGTFTIATIIAENDWLEEDREYVQLPPSLADAPHPELTD